MRLRTVVAVLSAIIVLSGLSARVCAQEVVEFTEVLAKDRPEAWAMKLIGSELLLTSMGVPSKIRSHEIQLGVEAGWIPKLSDQQRLIGFNGIKRENVNRTSLFGRPRVTIGLPSDVSITFGYIPPVRIGGIRPNVASFAVGRPLWSKSHWRLGGRIFGQAGNLKGDITCDRATVAAGVDPVRNPYQCEAPSKDTMKIRSVGMELGSAFPLSDKLEPYVGAAWNYFDTEFHTDAHYAGIQDRSVLLASGPTFALTTGISYRLSARIRLSGEFFYTPLDVSRGGVRVGDALMNLRGCMFYALK